MTEVAQRPEGNAAMSEPLPSLPSTSWVLGKLLLHSLAMFTFPFWAFYTCRDYAEQEYGVERPRSSVYAAGAAVAAVHVVILSYLYQAFKEQRIERRLRAAARKKK